MSVCKELGALQLREWLQTQPESVLLIDVRTPAEVARGVIGGACNIPLHLLPLRERELAAGKPVVFYCQTGARSAQACAFLHSRGHEAVYNLSGGIVGWVQTGQPVAPLQA